MMNVSYRNGSALLVVLGMISFMLFSGLAFSVYMRQSRMPTSFLRRTVSSRQLAKAALAEAMGEINDAIGNDPHPGVVTNVFVSSVSSNLWSHRVFFGSGIGYKKDPHDVGYYSQYPAYISALDSVPVLTLEGLAYLPPNLINEARYYSQRTPTAKWHRLWFDAGRYAYVAFDISDYLDVNRLSANVPRASSSGRRISLGYIFEDHDSGTSKASEWDSFMDKYRKIDKNTDKKTFTDCPFISFADFNLAWNNNFGSIKSPFANFVETGEFYSGGDIDKYREMSFVTDSWYPDPEESKPVAQRSKIDLESCQPFPDIMSRNNITLKDIFSYQSDIVNSGGNVDLAKRLSPLGLAALWDYLDEDSIPVSLAIPTLERVPMISAISINSLPQIKTQMSSSGTKTVIAGQQEAHDSNKEIQGVSQIEIYKVDTYKITFSGDARASVAVTCPFRHYDKNTDPNALTYDIEGRLVLGYSTSPLTLRPSGGNASLTISKDNRDLVKSVATANSVVTIPFAKQGGNQLTVDTISSATPNPVDQQMFKGDMSAAEQETVLFTAAYKGVSVWQAGQDGSGTWVDGQFELVEKIDNVANAQTIGNFVPLAQNGSVDNAFSSAANLVNTLKNGQDVDVFMNAAVWFRVYNGNKTYDMVPACVEYDNVYNDINNDSSVIANIGGSNPLMRFTIKDSNGNDFKYGPTEFAKAQTYQLKAPDPIIVSDPRYNHAPEDWRSVSSGGTDQNVADLWYKEASNDLGKDGRDEDIYMATSDQGYLQSVYEFAFLPCLAEDFNASGEFSGDYSINFNKTDIPSSQNDTLHNGLMWRTYRCYPSSDRDRFDELGLTSGDTGVKVNPYSDSPYVLGAAFANTPHDWRVASTNNDTTVDMTADSFNKKYAWNAYSSDDTGKLCWDCLEDFAEKFSAKVRSDGDWEAAFRNLDWSTDKRKLLGNMEELDSNDSDLYSVDKKFLYGFWHDSFSVRQQLFLIFLRAEPQMMGGGISGQTPPQLGARAVALVWRDPSPTPNVTSDDRKSDGDIGSERTMVCPHRMRVLFYHQFD